MLQATVLSGRPVVSVAGLGLLMASLLSVLYAVKFFAAGFANRPMRPGRLEVPAGMRVAQVVLAVIATGMGIAPGWVLSAEIGLLRALSPMAGVDLRAWGGALWPASGAFAPLMLLLIAGWALVLARVAMGPAPAPAAREAWMGGVPADRGAPRIHPHGFYSPIREALGRIYRAPRPPRGSGHAWVGPVVDMDRWFYSPAIRAGRPLVAGLRRIHTGVPNVYIAWQLAGGALLALSLLLLLRRGGAP
jgi:hydrogenase-4 component B